MACVTIVLQDVVSGEMDGSVNLRLESLPTMALLDPDEQTPAQKMGLIATAAIRDHYEILKQTVELDR